MIDAQDFLTQYKNHTKVLAQANHGNKTAVFDALTAGDITTVTVEFDGEGDSGQIEAITACKGEAHVTLPATAVTLHRASWSKSSLSTFDTPLSEAIEALCYDYPEQEHGGWENNEGGFGFFEFDVAKRTIQLEFNGRFSDVSTHNHDF